LNNRKLNISIVIPTLGSNKLQLTLDSIKNSTVEIFEVIIVIPIKFKFEFDISDYKELNIVTVITNKGGQVYQRSEGFKIVKGDFVLQLDDDIQFNKTFIENIHKTLVSLPKFSSVSPLLTNKSNKSVYRSSFTFLSRLFYAIFYFDFHLKEGAVNKFGKSFGIITNNKLLNVDWLPGGCVIHNRNNLVLENYFPFKSKAFMEDLLHSHFLKLNGVKLYIDSNLNAIISDPKDELNVNRLFIDKINELKIRKHYFNLVGLSYFNFYWSCFIDFGITFFKYLYLKIGER
jgi:glycosyltransferase involved in cell wall biosynthesis